MENEQPKDQPSISHRRKKRSLTDTEKTQIYEFHHDNPLVTHSDIAAIFRVDRSTVSKILQSNPLPNTATQSDHGLGTPAEAALQQQPRSEDALINWARAAGRNGTHVTRNMLRRQAAILAAEQWKSAQNYGSHLDACTSTDRPDTSFVESFDLSNPVMSLDRLNRDPAGVTDTCPTPILREETPISDLLSYCASGLSCDLDIGQHDAITGCNENICLDSGNIGESITPHSLKTPPIADTTNNSLGSLLGPSLPAELADHQRRNHTVHQLEKCNASLGQGNPALDVGLESHSAITDGVCLHEARRALSALELYLAGFPGQTALDELCLNHLRGRLGR